MTDDGYSVGDYSDGNGRSQDDYCRGCKIPGEVSDLKRRAFIADRNITNSMVEARALHEHIRKMFAIFGSQLTHFGDELKRIDDNAKAVATIVLKMKHGGAIAKKAATRKASKKKEVK